MLPNHDHDCNMLPPCFGNYQADCPYRDCERAVRLECLMVAQLEESRLARREREKRDRRRRGELGPRAAYLVRTFRYAPSQVRELDEGY